GVPDVVRGGWRHRCGDVLPRSRGWDSDRPPLLPPLAGRELRPAPSPRVRGKVGMGATAGGLSCPSQCRVPHPSPPPRRGGGSLRLLLPPLAGRELRPAPSPRVRGKVGMGATAGEALRDASGTFGRSLASFRG